MKKLINLIFGFLLVPSLTFSQDFFPELFKDYRKNGNELFSNGAPIININNFLYKIRLYDVNKDSIEDIIEAYLITGFSDKGFETLKEPQYYFLDFNMDKKIDNYEFLVDKEMDGLNGNEELIYLKPEKRTSFSKKEIKL